MPLIHSSFPTTSLHGQHCPPVLFPLSVWLKADYLLPTNLKADYLLPTNLQ